MAKEYIHGYNIVACCYEGVIMQDQSIKTSAAQRAASKRYKAEKTVSVQAYLPPVYRDKLDRIAEKAGTSKAQALKTAIDALYAAMFDEQPTEQE